MLVVLLGSVKGISQALGPRLSMQVRVRAHTLGVFVENTTRRHSPQPRKLFALLESAQSAHSKYPGRMIVPTGDIPWRSRDLESCGRQFYAVADNLIHLTGSLETLGDVRRSMLKRFIGHIPARQGPLAASLREQRCLASNSETWNGS